MSRLLVLCVAATTWVHHVAGEPTCAVAVQYEASVVVQVPVGGFDTQQHP